MCPAPRVPVWKLVEPLQGILDHPSHVRVGSEAERKRLEVGGPGVKALSPQANPLIEGMGRRGQTAGVIY